MPQRTPTDHGVLDPRLGVSNKNKKCATCGLQLKDCAGHFGYIKLPLPVFHQGYFTAILKTLQTICKACGRVLLPEEERAAQLRRLNARPNERGSNKAIIKRVLDLCKAAKVCPHCSAPNGSVKKLVGTYKLVHDPYSKHVDNRDALVEEFSTAVARNPELEKFLDRAIDDLNPARVLRLFERVIDSDLPLLDLATRPENLLVTYIAVPPVCIRPSVEMDTGGGSNEDDATTRLLAVCDMSISIRKNLDMGIASWETIMEQWDFLQVQCALYINSEHRLSLEYQKHDRKTHSRGFVQRLKGKQGRFRGNLSGKRVDFSGRTVISPDPNLRIDQVCVPQHQAAILTFPERVTRHNIEELRRAVVRGPQWPGANALQLSTGETFILRIARRREQLANSLKVGDVVERHCRDGDIVLFNRQPSLHRISIMALRAVVRPWRTLRFNECVCSPFNADFDGDEMNLHLPQTHEARAEAIQLMGTLANLRTPKSGEVMICATQDFLTAAFLLTAKDKFFTRAEFAQMCVFMGDALDRVDLPVPAIIKPLELWTGKQLFSVLVRPNVYSSVFVNVEMPEKVYTKGEHMCARDGYVCFINSELVSGRVGKGVLGGKKTGLFGTLQSLYGAEASGIVMTRLSKLSARFMGERGFSIGVTDVTPAPELVRRKSATIETNYAKCDDFIQQYSQRKLELLPGCDLEQSLETRLQGVLNNVRDLAGRVCMSTLHYHNAPLIMASCGSKGSPINIAQMVACVGQQSVGGKRCANGFKGRTTPHFPRGDKSPAGKGFVANSFYSGLTATEFFFHTMAGREGLVDTAVKTAETGYMSRRLMKSLEDLFLCYDGTVRNSSAGVVQLVYGDDNMDPLLMEGKDGRPLDLDYTLHEVKRTTQPVGRSLEERSNEVPLPHQLEALVAAQLRRGEFVGQDTCSDSFQRDLQALLRSQVATLAARRAEVGLPATARGDPFLEYLAGLPTLTPAQLSAYVDTCLSRYAARGLEPATPVGAIAAQSLGEPGTQMTLKTFHFAGVASMNVTLGVPRIKEIINAAKTISTPIMNVALEADGHEVAARMVKGRLECTTLGQICRSIKLVLSAREPCVAVTLDMRAIQALELRVNAHTVKQALLAARLRPKIKDLHVREVRYDKLYISPLDDAPEALSASLQHVLKVVPGVVVAGVPTIGRAVIQTEDGDGGRRRYSLAVEGTDFRAALTALGVDGSRTRTNNVVEIEAVLGVEAARSKIMEEIKYIFDQYGMGIDNRHIMLLADLMTYKGRVLGITRFGIVDMKESILHSASFERTTDQLFDAAAKGLRDSVSGVSESIILGMQMPIGTGAFSLLQQADMRLAPQRPQPIMAA